MWTLNRSGRGPKWLKGVVDSRNGPLVYSVTIQGSVRKVHVDHLRRCGTGSGEEPESMRQTPNISVPLRVPVSEFPQPSEAVGVSDSLSSESSDTGDSDNVSTPIPAAVPESLSNTVISSPVRTRPVRDRRSPKRLITEMD